jgi:hypothetical protein
MAATATATTMMMEADRYLQRNRLKDGVSGNSFGDLKLEQAQQQR